MAEHVDVPVPTETDEDGDEDAVPDLPSEEEAEVQEFRRWLRQRAPGRPRNRGATPRRSPRRRLREDDEDDAYDQNRTNAGPPPEWDGVQRAFEDYLIRARIWLSTTRAKPRTRGPLLLKALKDTPFQDFKYLAKDPQWLQSEQNADTLLDKMNSPEFYGDDQEEHLLASLARVTYHLKRQRNETARQFLAKWEAAERKVTEHRVELPSIYRGFLLINALALTDAEIKTLLNFTQGSIEPKAIRTWLRKHETKLQVSHLGLDPPRKGVSNTASSSTTTSAVHVLDEDEADDNEDPEITEMEAMLTDLAYDQGELATGEVGPFEESEAAEILAVMIKERRKTYTQSAQLKKDKELGRGYKQHGKGGNRDGPLRAGNYRLSITELKQRTKCRRCGRLGHWQRECPLPPNTKEQPAHFLEVNFDESDDVMFCNFLSKAEDEDPETSQDTYATTIDYEDATERTSEQDRVGPECSFEPTGYVGVQSGETPVPARVYMDLPCWDVLYGEVTFVRDEACATLDTGCQRTAVGAETLKKMRVHWPQELKWFKQNEVNRFRSVNGLSQTEYNAVIPCGIGKKGCYMKPAVFAGDQSKHAPFLVSLQFLLHCDAVISLARGNLELRLLKCNTTIPLHIGPSGALRLPMNRFDPVMIDSLRKAEVNLEDRRGKEFELLNLAQVSSGDQPTSHPGEPLRPESHGRRQQATATIHGDRGTSSPTLASSDGALSLCHPADHVLGLQLGPRGAGDEHGQPDRGRGHPDPLPQGPEICALRPNWTTASEHEMGETASSSNPMTTRPGGPPPPTNAGCRPRSTRTARSTRSEHEMTESEATESEPSAWTQPRRQEAPPSPATTTSRSTSRRNRNSYEDTESEMSYSVINEESVTNEETENMPLIIRPAVTDTSQQRSIWARVGENMLQEYPSCRCGKRAALEVSGTQTNPNRLFFKCAYSLDQSQEKCGFFQWCRNQALMDQRWEHARRQARRSLVGDPTNQQLLTAMMQNACHHPCKTKSGTNAFVKRLTCLNCQLLLSNERRDHNK